MSRARSDTAEAQLISTAKLSDWLARVKNHLYAYRPRFGDYRFWVIVSLVISIATLHSIVESQGYLHYSGIPYFIPTSLYLVPVVYAALNFGFAGAIATTLWAIVITTPNWVFWHAGLERFGCMFQLVIVSAVAYFLGRRVDRERSEWQRAEATATALKTSNIKYQNLLHSSPMAVLIVDKAGTILEVNSAASVLFNKDKTTLENMHISDLFGTANAQKLLSACQSSGRVDSVSIKLQDRLQLSIEPSLAEAGDDRSNPIIQLLLRDVTEEQHRQAGLRAYAAHVINTQEEERQRIARELHDETIQTLVLLCRQLDGMDNKSLPSPLLHNLQQARRTAEGVVEELRDFTRTLRPPILDDLGLITCVRRLLADLTERTGIKNRLEVKGNEQRLPPDMELALFRIAQEALRNVEHHAKANSVDTILTFAGQEVTLEVIDNGTGFSLPSDTSDFTASGHLGLISMQERAELLGGKIEIQSRPGEGTRVSVSVPMRL